MGCCDSREKQDNDMLDNYQKNNDMSRSVNLSKMHDEQDSHPLSQNKTDAVTRQFVVQGVGKKFETQEQIMAHIGDIDLDYSEVKSINLSGNSYGVEACRYLASIVAKFDNLQYVDLSDMFVSRTNQETPQSWEFFKDALMGKPIKELNLRDNAIGLQVIHKIEELLTESRHLEVLDMCNCGLGPAVGKIIAAKLSENKHCKLKVFRMSRSRLETSIDEISNQLRRMGSIEEIDISQNGIFKKLYKLFHGLETSADSLKVLKVQDNYIKYKSGRYMLKLIPKLTKLEELDISDCNVSKRNITNILKALHSNEKVRHTLKVISLGYNVNTYNTSKQVALQLRDKFPNLKEIMMLGDVKKTSNKRQLRDQFQSYGIKLVLEEADQSDDDDDDISEDESSDNDYLDSEDDSQCSSDSDW